MVIFMGGAFSLDMSIYLSYVFSLHIPPVALVDHSLYIMFLYYSHMLFIHFVSGNGLHTNL